MLARPATQGAARYCPSQHMTSAAIPDAMLFGCSGFHNSGHTAWCGMAQCRFLAEKGGPPSRAGQLTYTNHPPRARDPLHVPFLLGYNTVI